MESAAEPIQDRNFPCSSCGAELHFQPGSTSMECPYCGVQVAIAASTESVEELDFLTALERARSEATTEEHLTVDCPSCQARTSFDPNITVDECPFCGVQVSVQAKSTKAIKPRALLPFHIGRSQAAEAFKKWLSGLWFAPSALKKYALLGGLQGIYCPYWTYDCRSISRYTGQRGEHYYVTRSYTTTDSNGNRVRRTRRERRTRWYPASGTVQNAFDDVLVVASRSLPPANAEALEPWDLEQLVPFEESYLSGFRVQSYQVDLEEGFGEAQHRMEPQIRQTVRADIGGDEQRITSLDVRYFEITFKHILLPKWISAYRYRNKVYHFLVNARTGEVKGQRPWSWFKILSTAMFLAMLLIILTRLL